MSMLQFLFSVSLAIAGINAGPIQTINQAENYLSQFGYLAVSSKNVSVGNRIDLDNDAKTLSKAIMDFQGFARINVTGELNKETLELMSLPRCGVRDKVSSDSGSRRKRYALQGSRWKVNAITYRITKYPKRLVNDEVDKEIEKAFAVWSEYIDITFTPKKTNPVHIEIRFEEGEHGDGDPFDGPGGTLAHAYFPVYGGDAHFDDTEYWTIGSNGGTNLFQVAAHEFGHSLGLSHSDVQSALMAPFYRGYDPVFRLDSDDIQAIQEVYGKKSFVGRRNPVKPPKPIVPKGDMCTDAKIDTIFNTIDGSTYAFKGNYYYKLSENKIADGYPKTISEGWPGLPSNIDAAFTYKNGKTYFFKGPNYWRYSRRSVDGDYPKKISNDFSGIPDNVDAALVWGGNGKIYFYKGTKFWRYDPLEWPPVKSTYPKPLSIWRGIPNNVDAGFQYTNGYTYFFKGNKYYRFNDRTFTVDEAAPPFPRPSAVWWFGCENTSTLFDVRVTEPSDNIYE